MLGSLTALSLRSRADRLGFRNAGNLEKFIADFDAHSAISRSLQCHVRGGLCFPLHVPSKEHRLSTDLDLYTPTALDDVIEAVPGLLAEGGFTSISTRWQSRKDRPIRHLVRFVAHFRSKFDAIVPIYVDISCGADTSLIDTVTIPSGYEMMGIQTEREISALSWGTLMADKFPSIGIGTVGYNSLRCTPKQIYDIGKLVQHASTGDFESMLSIYGKLTGFMLSRDSRGYTTNEVTASIVSYLEKLGSEKGSPDVSEHWDHFTKFSSSMLSKRQQARDDHMERILIMLACARSLARSLEPGASHAGEAARLCAVRDGARAQPDRDSRLGFLREELGLAA